MVTENFILIENVTEPDVEMVLSNLANLYSSTGFTNRIELYKYNRSNHTFLVTFKNDPNFDHFAYFINYMKYPEGFENWKPVVKGFYQIKPAESKKDFKPGDWLQMYISKNDSAYDNVSIVNTADESFLFDFGGKTKKLSFTEEKYHLPNIQKSECTLLKTIVPIAQPQPEISKPWWKFW